MSLTQHFKSENLWVLPIITFFIVGIFIGFTLGTYYYFDYLDKKGCIEFNESLTIYELNRENYNCVLDQDKNKITSNFIASEWERLWEYWNDTINECDSIDYQIRALAPFSDWYKNIERMTGDKIDEYNQKCSYPNNYPTPTFDQHFGIKVNQN